LEGEKKRAGRLARKRVRESEGKRGERHGKLAGQEERKKSHPEASSLRLSGRERVGRVPAGEKKKKPAGPSNFSGGKEEKKGRPADSHEGPKRKKLFRRMNSRWGRGEKSAIPEILIRGEGKKNLD